GCCPSQQHFFHGIGFHWQRFHAKSSFKKENRVCRFSSNLNFYVIPVMYTEPIRNGSGDQDQPNLLPPDDAMSCCRQMLTLSNKLSARMKFRSSLLSSHNQHLYKLYMAVCPSRY